MRRSCRIQYNGQEAIGEWMIRGVVHVVGK